MGFVGWAVSSSPLDQLRTTVVLPFDWCDAFVVVDRFLFVAFVYYAVVFFFFC